MPISASSQERVKAIVDWFIRSEMVQAWTSDKDGDFINEPERAGRVYDAAEHGADGKTHAEVIEDWRECWAWFINYGRKGRAWSTPDRLDAAVCAHFDSVEAWHEANGSLWQEIG